MSMAKIGALVSVAAALAATPSMAVAAKMTKEQARDACRSEIPQVPTRGGDRGGSRGFKAAGSNPMRECIKAKMSGK